MELKEKEEFLNTTNTDLIEKEKEEVKEKQEEVVKEKEKEKQEEVKNAETFKIINDNENINHSDVLKIFGILTLIFMLLLSITYFTFTLFNVKNETIAKGVYICNIDVSHLTKEEAKQKVTNYINSTIPEEIKLKHNDFETSISTSQLSIYFNIDEAIDIAYQIGRTDNIFKNNLLIIKTLLSKTTITPGLSIDDEQLQSILKNISNNLPDKMIETSYYIDENNLIITKGKSGNIVKIEKTANYIKNSINNLNFKNNTLELITEKQSPKPIVLDEIYNEIHKEPVDAYYTQNPYTIIPSENGLDFAISLEEAHNLLQEEKDEYTIPLKVLYPNVTTNMIGTEAFPDMLSNFSTKYAASNKNRTTNLILAANKINGTVLMPGEIFSYNKVVGERTIAAGYKEAPIYVNGKVEDGLGGGICQITTTLYNAALYANLEILERSNHQFVPSYANASRDATVVYGAIDFKFKNNREYPIKITCSVANGIANFKIFGLKSENDYEVQITSRITGTTSTAIYSEAYKTLKKNGTVISTERISKDTYKKH